MTLLSWDIPLISFNGSLWDVLLRCSKWLLGAWLDSFTMILRCWLVIWVKWARPLVLWHCDPELCSIEKRFLFISWAVLHHWKSMGQLWDAPAPQGCNFYPFWGMVLQSRQPLQVWWFISFYEILGLSYDPPKFAQLHCQWDFLGDYLPLGRTSYPRSLIKVIAARFPIRPHVLTPHSWLCDKKLWEE